MATPKNTSAPVRKPSTTDTALDHAVRDYPFPPPDADSEWWDGPPSGAFDVGIARVMGHQGIFDFARFSRNPLNGGEDHVGKLQLEVKRSYAFARFVTVLINAARISSEEGDTKEEAQRSVAYELSRIGSTAFLAGWFMGQEYLEIQQASRQDASKGSLEELVELLSRHIDFGDDGLTTICGKVNEKNEDIAVAVLTSRGHWTREQVTNAFRILESAGTGTFGGVL